jgi:TatA/E family protein of Tat protein translocase
MFGLDIREIIIVAGVIVLLFGSKKIPELTKSIADGIRHIRGVFSDKKENSTTQSTEETT